MTAMLGTRTFSLSLILHHVLPIRHAYFVFSLMDFAPPPERILNCDFVRGRKAGESLETTDSMSCACLKIHNSSFLAHHTGAVGSCATALA